MDSLKKNNDVKGNVSEVILVAGCDPRTQLFGGIRIYAYYLAQYLANQGINVIFLAKQESDMPIQDDHESRLHKNIKVIVVNKSGGESNISYLRELYPCAKSLKASGQFSKNTIIHFQRPDWALPFKNFPGKQVITLHGSHRKNVYLKWGKVLGNIFSRIEKRGLKQASSVISVSTENTAYYKSLYETHKSVQLDKKITTIPIGVDLDKFKPSTPKKRDDVIEEKLPATDFVLFIGRLEKEKNVELLMRGCENSNVPLVIVGDGRERIKLKEVARNSKTPENFVFLGAVDNSYIPYLLQRCKIFGMTSLYEGLPTVAIEALASGKPIIATPVGDIPLLVEDGVTGYLINENTISEKLTELLNQAADFEKNCLERAEQYSWQAIGDKILQLYNQIVNED